MFKDASAEFTEFQPEKRPTLCDQTVAYLTNYVLENKLAPGDLLPSEGEFCKRLAVSRATLREAVRVLEARGLIDRRHGVGIFVSDRSLEVAGQSIQLLLQQNDHNIDDLLEVRLGLECHAAGLAAMRSSDLDIQSMEDSLKTMSETSAPIEHAHAADLEFHLRLARSSQNFVLATLIKLIQAPLFDSIRATYALDGHTERRIHDHVRILDAIRERDPNAARDAMRLHLKNAERNFRRIGILRDNDS